MGRNTADKTYFWERYSPQDCRRIEQNALRWFEREMAAMRQREKTKRIAAPNVSVEEQSRADDPLAETPAKRRQRKRGERLAGVVREHAEQLRPIILDIIADDIGELLGR